MGFWRDTPAHTTPTTQGKRRKKVWAFGGIEISRMKRLGAEAGAGTGAADLGCCAQMRGSWGRQGEGPGGDLGAGGQPTEVFILACQVLHIFWNQLPPFKNGKI